MKPNLTEEQAKEIERAMQSVWTTIAPDMLQSNVDCNPRKYKDVYQVQMKRAEVIDVLLDQTYGRWDNCFHQPSAAANDAWRLLTNGQQMKWMKLWFNQKTYGY